MTQPDRTNPHAWNLSDLDRVPSNGFKVMSTFSCGGGSCMGYKLAGFDVVAANDIDAEMIVNYKRNFPGIEVYACPIIELTTRDLPPHLFDLDLLDGSPPCSTFSFSGNREGDWGKNKMFREGQKTQVLSDLFFEWIALVGRLRPKVAVAENVYGLIQGAAKGYTRLIFKGLREIGYRPQLFLLNAADCGVPQTRRRVFFVAVRNDIDVPALTLAPAIKWVTAGEATCDLPEPNPPESTQRTHRDHWHKTRPLETYKLSRNRLGDPSSALFNYVRLSENDPSCTLTAVSHAFSHWNSPRVLSFAEFKRLCSFPDDYAATNDKIGKYLCGMSVPPRMMEQVAIAVRDQWLIPARQRQVAA